MLWVNLDSWIKMYAWPTSRPAIAALWLVALYAFPTALGTAGAWIWLVPTILCSWARLIAHRVQLSGYG